jgi:hypothetical protein
MAAAPNSGAETVVKAPLKVAVGVRIAEIMYASCISRDRRTVVLNGLCKRCEEVGTRFARELEQTARRTVRETMMTVSTTTRQASLRKYGYG